MNDPDLDCAQVLSDPMLLALPEWHPLASSAELAPHDLAGQEWIAVLHKESALKHDHFVAACARAGFTPDIRMEATEPLTALGLVAAGLGMAMIQHSLRHHAPPGVVLRELPTLVHLPYPAVGRLAPRQLTPVGGDFSRDVARRRCPNCKPLVCFSALRWPFVLAITSFFQL